MLRYFCSIIFGFDVGIFCRFCHFFFIVSITYVVAVEAKQPQLSNATHPSDIRSNVATLSEKKAKTKNHHSIHHSIEWGPEQDISLWVPIYVVIYVVPTGHTWC